MKCPNDHTLTNSNRCDYPGCGWVAGKKSEPAIAELMCMKCRSTDVYIRIGLNWLCYNHTAKQHRSFVHNMFDYKHENRQASDKECWLYAMQFEKEDRRFDEKYYDEKVKRKGDLQYNEQHLLSQIKIPDESVLA